MDGIGKVLVCNRGEIAVRVIRACRELGIPSAVAYSAADSDSRAVRLADEAVCVGPGPSPRSYLNVPALVHAAGKVGADAVHPGYGFLSEDAHFARVCGDLGITFIGPTPEVITAMGDKTNARRAMAAAGLPVPPGSEDPLSGPAEAAERAAEIGYPVILKAAAGGGGKGMRVVHRPEDLADALADVAHTARTIFLDDRVYLESFITAARHVEVQILGDQHGSIVHLGERDCSIQRRQQKLVEESPSTVLSAEMRERMCAAAVAGARAVGYSSAGTVEFLVDPAAEFYFMEMNSRIQVEHPVTEVRSGVDLVAWMIRVAAGEPLAFGQADIAMTGHAIECRINSEDAANGWAGSFGTLERFVPPAGPGVRVDTHGFPGYRIPPYYDSLLAKVIVHADTRAEAMARMDRALAEFDCAGVATTIGFHRALMAHPRFRAGTHRLDFVENHLTATGELSDTEL
ncbi:acetyl-CoA carboxylase biotin carboxylase subunit [Actinokineospora iranica]|uniref:biotin carboxylase n=1 Tax=Actinokineospora iranica TaxID=1271860 RepID=A0A1G6SPQ5_9PSEU|nr:acetyl-CoA carboxylase biotin carboxylase subunit [Actinokineospora iranica]SDD18783.1 biotin carboxylase [Actinokineospora iranica]